MVTERNGPESRFLLAIPDANIFQGSYIRYAVLLYLMWGCPRGTYAVVNPEIQHRQGNRTASVPLLSCSTDKCFTLLKPYFHGSKEVFSEKPD